MENTVDSSRLAGLLYCMFPFSSPAIRPVPSAHSQFSEDHVPGQPDTTQYFTTTDDVLNYMVDSGRLRDVITQVTVLDRTI